MRGELLAWHRKYPDDVSVVDEPSTDAKCVIARGEGRGL
jgi:hypothetical protein